METQIAQTMNQLLELDLVKCEEPVSSEVLDSAERLLIVIFLEDYREFCRNYGALNIFDFTVLGIRALPESPSSREDAITATQRFRINEEIIVPNNYVFIGRRGCEEAYLLRCSGEDSHVFSYLPRQARSNVEFLNFLNDQGTFTDFMKDCLARHREMLACLSSERESSTSGEVFTEIGKVSKALWYIRRLFRLR